MDSDKALAFQDLSLLVQELERPPKIIILENVFGLVQRSRNNGVAPIDFIRRATCVINGRTVRFGVEFWRDYTLVCEPVILSSGSLGLPMPRRRIFLILVRNDSMRPDLTK
ncbi:MAG: hypothetical protein ACKPKO_22930, partial [Candidatus Fonsibacter sp.]